MSMNRFAVAQNIYQGTYKKVLCVCSAGVLRSPTAAVVLSQPPYNFNTRAAGVNEDFALVYTDGILLHWADEIVCMEQEHADAITSKLVKNHGKKIIVLNIEDTYMYRDPGLVREIIQSYEEQTKVEPPLPDSGR